MAQNPSRFAGPVDQDWLNRHTEPVLEPELPIIDPHHHLWTRDGNVYLLPELLADIASGHNVWLRYSKNATRCIAPPVPTRKSRSAKPNSSPASRRWVPAGRSVPRKSALAWSAASISCSAPARGRCSNVTCSPAAGDLPASGNPPRGMPAIASTKSCQRRECCSTPRSAPVSPHSAHLVWYSMPGFIIRNFPKLRISPPPFPNTRIVLNHVGSPILGGPYAADRDKVFADWRAGMANLANQPNVTVKLGALPIRLPGLSSAAKDTPPSSEEVAAAWRPWLETSIELFGADRCMFESNFPVQKRWCSYQVVWNAFKRLAANASAAEKAALFAGTAARVYGVPLRMTGFSDRIWQRTTPLRDAIHALNFNTELAAGTLAARKIPVLYRAGCAVSRPIRARPRDRRRARAGRRHATRVRSLRDRGHRGRAGIA